MPTALAALVYQRASRSVHLCGALKEALLDILHPLKEVDSTAHAAVFLLRRPPDFGMAPQAATA